MNALEAILSRCTVRNYSDKSVSSELIDKIVQAGTSAPSAYNRQPWAFFVVKNKKILEEISQFDPYASMARKASFGILVCADLTLEDTEGFWVQDCSAAIQNMSIAATSLGLGSAWTTIYPFKEMILSFKRLFDLPEHLIPVAFIPVGYPAQGGGVSGKVVKGGRVHYIE